MIWYEWYDEININNGNFYVLQLEKLSVVSFLHNYFNFWSINQLINFKYYTVQIYVQIYDQF